MNKPDRDTGKEQSRNGDSSVSGETHHSPPIQFSIASLLCLTAAVALVFGVLRWMQVSATTCLIVMAVLAVGGVAVVVLVAAISKVDHQ
jgi:uncharacterized membrane-anchored protein